MTRYLLDTDTLSWLVRDPAGAVARHVATVGEEALATSPIVAGDTVVIPHTCIERGGTSRG